MFTCRVQSSSETVAQFVTELREKAAKCGLAAQVVERVRDQMVAWLFEPKMRERLLQESDNSTLEHMVQPATTLERLAQEGPALGESKQAALDASARQDQDGVINERQTYQACASTAVMKVTVLSLLSAWHWGKRARNATN